MGVVAAAGERVDLCSGKALPLELRLCHREEPVPATPHDEGGDVGPTQHRRQPCESAHGCGPVVAPECPAGVPVVLAAAFLDHLVLAPTTLEVPEHRAEHE